MSLIIAAIMLLGVAEAQIEATVAVEQAPPPPQWLEFEATAYTADCLGCIGITKTGVDVRATQHHEGKRVIAVDPNVIELGSTVELRLADGTTLEATAQDIGGAIKGRRVDVLVASYDEAIQFGRQTITLREVGD